MIVSLEAIFLPTLVLITQNRLTAEAERRANLDPHVGLLSEHELTRVLMMLDAIHRKFQVEPEVGSELSDLEIETRPEDVLAEIARLQRSAAEAASTRPSPGEGGTAPACSPLKRRPTGRPPGTMSLIVPPRRPSVRWARWHHGGH